MSDTRDSKRSRRAWELAGRQHGIVARRQLLALGFSPGEIEHRTGRARLHVVMRDEPGRVRDDLRQAATLLGKRIGY